MCARPAPLVSVILPTYGRPSLLADAVGSVERQTYPNLELVVVDDHSPTPAASVLDDLDVDATLPVECLRHEQNRGANAARNAGLDVANGDLIAFLDDDDVWLPEKVERQVDRFREASDDVGVVYTGQRFVDETGATTSVRTPTTRGDVTEQLLAGAPLGPFSTLMVESDLVETAGDLDERFPSWQDREWCIRLSRHCRFEPVDDPLVVRRMHGDRQISDDFEAKRDRSYPLLLEKYRDLAADQGPRAERRFVAALSVSVARTAFRNDRFREAIPYLLKAIRCSPGNVAAYCYLLVAAFGKYLYEPARLAKRSGRRLVDGARSPTTDVTNLPTRGASPPTDRDRYPEETSLAGVEEVE